MSMNHGSGTYASCLNYLKFDRYLINSYEHAASVIIKLELARVQICKL